MCKMNATIIKAVLIGVISYAVVVNSILVRGKSEKDNHVKKGKS